MCKTYYSTDFNSVYIKLVVYKHSFPILITYLQGMDYHDHFTDEESKAERSK